MESERYGHQARVRNTIDTTQPGMPGMPVWYINNLFQTTKVCHGSLVPAGKHGSA
ncbi:MAG: hypothetical protein HC828_16320 [Blastochloris sp.]|nr:hypothetical protein [Blastochloris sp.]